MTHKHNKKIRQGFPYGSVDELPTMEKPMARKTIPEVCQTERFLFACIEYQNHLDSLREFPLTSPFTGSELIEGKTFEFAEVKDFSIPQHSFKSASFVVKKVARPIQKEDSKEEKETASEAANDWIEDNTENYESSFTKKDLRQAFLGGVIWGKRNK